MTRVRPGNRSQRSRGNRAPTLSAVTDSRGEQGPEGPATRTAFRSETVGKGQEGKGIGDDDLLRERETP